MLFKEKIIQNYLQQNLNMNRKLLKSHFKF